MLDNGASLGSGGVHPHRPRHGSENDFDVKAISMRFLSLGAYERPWQDIEDAGHPETIGFYSAEGFLPGDWKPSIPNPTFNSVTPADGYWAAKIVMSFTDEQLAGAMDATQWSDAAARAYILDGLRDRRNAIGRYWFAEVSPLDRPRVESGALVFDDLWTRFFGGPTSYRWEFDWDATDPDLESEGTASAAAIRLPVPESPIDADPSPDERYAEIEVWKVFGDGEVAPRPATFWLEWTSGSWRVVGARY